MNVRRRFSSAAAGFALIALLGLTASPLQAQISVWAGLGADNNWSTVANWDTVPVSGAGYTVQFNNAGAQANPNQNIGNPISLLAISFGGVSGFTLGGNPIILAPLAGGTGIDNTSLAAQIINNNLNLTASQTFNSTLNSLTINGNQDITGIAFTANPTGGSITIAAPLSGLGGTLTKSGAGTLTLSGAIANSFSGDATVNAGTLSLNKTANVNAIAGNLRILGGTVSLSASEQIANGSALTLLGGTFSNQSFNETLGAFSLNTSSTIALGAGGAAATLTFASAVRTGGTLTITGWSGTAGQSGTDDRIFVTAAPDSTFLNNVTFSGYSAGATILGTGELTPVPEPKEYALAAGLALVVFAICRKRSLVVKKSAGGTNPSL